jgi:hypothetical protein
MRLFLGIVQTIRRDRRHGGPGFPCRTNRLGALATYLLGEAAVSTYVSARHGVVAHVTPFRLLRRTGRPHHGEGSIESSNVHRQPQGSTQ